MTNFSWKVHLALLPLYALVLSSVAAIFFAWFCFAIQFGMWGVVGMGVIVWYFGGLIYAWQNT